MQIIKYNQTNQKEIIPVVCKTLAAGGLVIYPTETVYGIGVDATNPIAVEKLLKYKSRREGKPLSIAVTDKKMAQKYVEFSNQAEQFYDRFLPGPYTLVSKGKHLVAPFVESEFGTLGIRISSHPLISEIVKTFGKPITATSANASGEKRPYSIQDILDRLSEKQKKLINLIIDAGTLPPNEPSIVIDTTLSTPLTVRGQLDISRSQTFTTNSNQETRDLAGKLLLKNWNTLKEKGLIIGLNGELGTGKTVFTQGIAQFLQIKEQISSPTYTYMNEYHFNRHNIDGQLLHLDVWKIDSKEMFNLLEIPKLIKPNTVVVIEWWQQIANYWPTNLPITFTINLEETGENSRKILLQENQQ
ncbi:MAG: hypothetical protein COU63_01225 [Candidatus Pacebacteria bacterium CG10_big_fil_rev_8_21_14_0_10_36_11]|nr:threonylcarbamoyl-AMP synthase [Candidatus Pacearchaeota archaeon]OIP73790.1 MAG: hypothetical protein AUK08_04495 [Candidatus Pacebacteria bacterium CG2_30_36_39]PIR64624.1 MAG: hypothetical protein COU63_01225 [Candidatus Pacebacteria bacterium CG10_big_fil_rev_8_21_14_0_10_36_11]PJC43023.1 MAG: hypothetical protein CO040_01425 [Candidatus Pacebacteria bacterium CG_4_9_14_0_2_um_filter_36_8]